MLTVDLNKKATSTERQEFNDEMAERQWKKIDALTTTWWVRWKDDIKDGSIIKTTKSDVASSAKAAGISSYDAAVAISDTKPEVWSG